MKDKSRFKTDIGAIPKNWEECIFSEAVEINPKRELKKGSVSKFVSMSDLKEFDKKIQAFVTRKFSGGSKFINDDTLMARITPCLENGKTAYVDILDKGEVGSGSTEFIVLSGKEGRTISQFVYYLAISPKVRTKAIQSMTGTSGRQRVENDVFDKIVINLPSLSEQQFIAKALSDLDSKIELNQQINKTLEAIGQALFKHWFINFEFPNENGEPYKLSGGEMVDSELGEIPKGWEIKEISGCGDVICGKTPPTSDQENYGEDIPFITIPNMRGQVIIVKTERKLSKQGADLQKNKELPPLAICVSCIATPGLVSLTSEISHTNQQINSIVCSENVSPYFMYYSMVDKSEQIKTMGLGGTATLNLNTGNFSKIKIIIPSDKIMKDFDKLLKPIFNNILCNQKENLKLIEIRDSLLPRLMSGKIRVPVEVR